MIVGAATQRPMIFAILLADGQIIDRRMARGRKAVLVKLPVLVAIGTKPVAQVVMPFIGEADGDAIVAKCPQFLDQTVIKLARPLAPKKRDYLLSADEKLGPVAPPARWVVPERNPFRIARRLVASVSRSAPAPQR